MSMFTILLAFVTVASPPPARPLTPRAAVTAAVVAQAVLVRGAPLTLVPPVVADIVDHFRPPSCKWCAGNRGLEYNAAAGADVGAAAAGVVTFAGPVAGVIFVVVDHGGGFRTTYGRLAAPVVGVGDALAAGDIVGQAGSTGLYFGLRRVDEYLDPERYFGGARPTRARLAP
jgi:murein DD-endopeptidase MepM/ murein hydrolase activator NlpD